MKKITILLPNLGAGGAERVMLNIASGFSQHGYNVDLILLANEGEYLSHIPPNIRLITFFNNSKNLLLKSFLLGGIKYIRYLRLNSPTVVISTLSRTNLFSLCFGLLSLTNCQLIVREAATLRNVKSYFLKFLIKSVYPVADKIICVSQGVKEDLLAIGLSDNKLIVINNPVDIEYIKKQAEYAPNHPWIVEKDGPIILGIGRLAYQKGFDILVQAFSLVRKKHPAKLIILGEGELRKDLLEMCRQLNIQDYVDFPGYVDNPYGYLNVADIFVLSSRWEGFVNVLLEAISLGTSIVATDCRSGPREILRDGELGTLVPIEDANVMADAIMRTLASRKNPTLLINRALDFAQDKIVNHYVELVRSIPE